MTGRSGTPRPFGYRNARHTGHDAVSQGRRPSHLLFSRAIATPSRASWSARSFSSWPAWPLTQCQRTSCVLERGIEPLPQIDVLDRLLVGGAPAVPLPAVDPAGDALTHILAVGVEIDGAGPLQRFQRRDRRHQLHAVVGGVRLAALQLLLDVAEFQDRAPAARPGIARAGAVGVDDDAGSELTPPAPRSRRRSRACSATLWWKRSLRKYSSGSFGRTSAPGGTLSQSTSRVSRKRSAAPRASSGSASCSASRQRRARGIGAAAARAPW